MRRAVCTAIILIGLATVASAPADEPLANHGRKGLQVKSIDEMLKLPEEEIDIGMAVPLICDVRTKR